MLGPLFYKELLEVSRRRRYYLARTLVGVAMLIGLWWGFASIPPTVTLANRPLPTPWTPRVSAIGPKTERITTAQLAEIGRTIYDGWTYGLWAGLFLIVPAVTSGLIAGEKDSRTLEILFTTCLTDHEILLGKLASRLIWIFILLLSSFPVLAIASWYGGFSPGEVAAVALSQGAAAVFMAFLGLYYSTITQKPYVALIRTYLMLMVFEGCIYGLPAVVMPGIWSSIVVTGTLVPAYIGIHLAMSAMLFAWSKRRLRRAWMKTGDPLLVRFVRWLYGGVVAAARRFVERRQRIAPLRHLWHLEKASERWGRPEYWFGDQVNPLLQRNSSANVYDPQRYIAAIQITIWVAVVALAIYVAQWEPDALLRGSNRFLLAPAMLTILLLLLVLASSSFARERQYGSWEVLLLTDLTPWQFLSGTALGILRTLWPMLALFALATVLMGYSVLLSTTMFGWLIIVISIAVLMVMICLVNSLISQNINEAMVRSFVSILLIQAFGRWVLPPFHLPLDAYTEAFAIVIAGWAWVASKTFHLSGRGAVAGNGASRQSKSGDVDGDRLRTRTAGLLVLVPATIALGTQAALRYFERGSFDDWVRTSRAPSYLDFGAWVVATGAHFSEWRMLMIATQWMSTVALALILLYFFDRLAGRTASRS